MTFPQTNLSNQWTDAEDVNAVQMNARVDQPLNALATSLRTLDAGLPLVIIAGPPVFITPTAANTPTSRVIAFTAAQQALFTGSGALSCQVSVSTTTPGVGVTGYSYSDLSTTGVTLWVTRTTTTSTQLSWWVAQQS